MTVKDPFSNFIIAIFIVKNRGRIGSENHFLDLHYYRSTLLYLLDEGLCLFVMELDFSLEASLFSACYFFSLASTRPSPCPNSPLLMIYFYTWLICTFTFYLRKAVR